LPAALPFFWKTESSPGGTGRQKKQTGSKGGSGKDVLEASVDFRRSLFPGIARCKKVIAARAQREEPKTGHFVPGMIKVDGGANIKSAADG